LLQMCGTRACFGENAVARGEEKKKKSIIKWVGSVGAGPSEKRYPGVAPEETELELDKAQNEKPTY